MVKKAGRRMGSKSSRSLAEARTGLFRATLLFGSAAVALSLIVVPEVDRRSRLFAEARNADVDPTITGSIAPVPSEPKRYTQRRSVLDDAEREPCLMFPDGSQRGSC